MCPPFAAASPISASCLTIASSLGMFACAWISAARTFAMYVVSFSLAERRNDCLAVFLDDRLGFLHHKAEVELVDAHLDQFLDPFPALLDRPDDAEPVEHVVGDEVGVSCPTL